MSVILCYDPGIQNSAMVIYNYEKNVIELSQNFIYKDSDKKSFKKYCYSMNLLNEDSEKEFFTHMWKNERLSKILNIMSEKAMEKKVDIVLCESQFGDRMSDTNTVPKIVAGNLKAFYKEYKPTNWKKFLTGNGKATEELIASMVKDFTGNFFKYLSVHEIDCFAIILTYLKQNSLPVKEIKP